MNAHVNSTHTKEKSWTCTHCQMTTYNQSSMSRHKCRGKPSRKQKHAKVVVGEVKLEEPKQEEPQYDIPLLSSTETPDFQQLEQTIQFDDVPEPLFEQPQLEIPVGDIPQSIFQESLRTLEPALQQSEVPVYFPDCALYVPPPDVPTIAVLQRFMHKLQFASIADIQFLIPTLWLVIDSNVTTYDTQIFWYYFIEYFRMLDGDIYLSILYGGAFEDRGIQDIVTGILMQAEAAALHTLLPLDQASSIFSPQTPQYPSPSISPVPSPTWSMSSAASSSVESLILDAPIENSFHNFKEEFTQESAVFPDWLDTPIAPDSMADMTRMMQGIGAAY